MSKLAGKNQKWGRCRVPCHQHCSVVDEIRHPVARSVERHAHLKQELELGMEEAEIAPELLIDFKVNETFVKGSNH